MKASLDQPVPPTNESESKVLIEKMKEQQGLLTFPAVSSPFFAKGLNRKEIQREVNFNQTFSQHILNKSFQM